MNKVTMSGSDGFWARVRAMLGRGPEDAELVLDDADFGQRVKKSRPPQEIDEALRRGWNEAALRRVSLCVLAMDLDGYADYFAAYGQETVEATLSQLSDAIDAVLPREGQRCLRSGPSGFVIVLEDMPGLMGRELAARIAVAVRREGVPHRESHAGHVTLSMGLAVVNPEGAVDRSVLDVAADAVKKAQRRGIARLEIVDLRIQADKRRQAA